MVLQKKNRVPGSDGTSQPCHEEQSGQIHKSIPISYSSVIKSVLGAEKKNRLESILSELIIFAMNTGQWRHATLAQKAYQQIADVSALGPIISSAYIAMGHGKLASAIIDMKNKQTKVTSDQVWGLRAFIGMFMIFNNDTAKAKLILEDVAINGDSASQQMASQLLLQFFNAKKRSNVHVPGLPI